MILDNLCFPYLLFVLSFINYLIYVFLMEKAGLYNSFCRHLSLFFFLETVGKF